MGIQLTDWPPTHDFRCLRKYEGEASQRSTAVLYEHLEAVYYLRGLPWMIRLGYEYNMQLL